MCRHCRHYGCQPLYIAFTLSDHDPPSSLLESINPPRVEKRSSFAHLQTIEIPACDQETVSRGFNRRKARICVSPSLLTLPRCLSNTVTASSGTRARVCTGICMPECIVISLPPFTILTTFSELLVPAKVTDKGTFVTRLNQLKRSANWFRYSDCLSYSALSSSEQPRT